MDEFYNSSMDVPDSCQHHGKEASSPLCLSGVSLQHQGRTMKNSDLDVPELPYHGKEASSLPVNSDFFDSSNNIINLAKSYSVDPHALMSSRTMKCTFEF